jgi:hypothetical protein
MPRGAVRAPRIWRRAGACLLRQPLVVASYGLEGGRIQPFEIDHLVPCSAYRPNQLVELDLYRPRVPVLRVLNQEDHEERHDRGGRVDHQLPGIGEPEQGAHREPQHDQEHGRPEAGSMTRDPRDAPGESAEPARPVVVVPGRHRDFAHDSPHLQPIRLVADHVHQQQAQRRANQAFANRGALHADARHNGRDSE